MPIPFRRKRKTLAAVHPNAGTRALYRRKLEKLVDEMATSVEHWVQAVYRANEPLMAMDAGFVTTRVTSTPGGKRWIAVVDGKDLLGAGGKPRLFKSSEAAYKAGLAAPRAPTTAPRPIRKPLPAADLQKAINDLAVRWQGQFDEAAPQLARWFATATAQRSDAALQGILARAGYSVEFTMTRATQDVMKATVEQNVQLIRTIPQQYLAGVQGDVMRSVQSGRDIGQLAADLRNKYGVTKRRAAFIAKDQNNKATSAIQKTRQLELGLDRGVWMHSSGGKEPRPKHVRADGVEFDLRKGLKVGDNGGWVMPGEEPNCRCVWGAVIPGF